MEKRGNVGKGNVSRKENIYKTVEGKDYDLYWVTTRDSGYMQENSGR